MAPSSGRLPRSGLLLCAQCWGIPLAVSACSRDWFVPCLCFGAVAVPRGAGSSVPLAHKTGWVAWHGVPLGG